jgi:hypothetical protein
MTKNELFTEDNIFNFEDIILSDKENACIQQIKSLTEFIPHSDTTFFNHLYNTFRILKNLNQSEDVCLAGLYHSVYDTDFFKANLNLNDEDVIDKIGKYSNFLVKVFCSADRDDCIFRNTLCLPTNVNKDLLYILYANEVEQSKRIGQELNFYSAIVSKIILLETYCELGKTDAR